MNNIYHLLLPVSLKSGEAFEWRQKLTKRETLAASSYPRQCKQMEESVSANIMQYNPITTAATRLMFLKIHG